jgi:hypothetical protein
MTVQLSLLSNLYIINRFILQKLCNTVLKPLKMKFTKNPYAISQNGPLPWNDSYLASSACSNNVSETFKLFGFYYM